MEKLDSKTLDKPLYVSPKCQKHEPVKLVQGSGDSSSCSLYYVSLYYY